MTEFLNWVYSHAGGLGILGAAIAFSWSVIQFVWLRRLEFQESQFKKYHELIKELVSPEGNQSQTYLDRQIAVVFELRHFK